MWEMWTLWGVFIWGEKVYLKEGRTRGSAFIWSFLTLPKTTRQNSFLKNSWLLMIWVEMLRKEIWVSGTHKWLLYNQLSSLTQTGVGRKGSGFQNNSQLRGFSVQRGELELSVWPGKIMTQLIRGICGLAQIISHGICDCSGFRSHAPLYNKCLNTLFYYLEMKFLYYTLKINTTSCYKRKTKRNFQ